MSSVSKSFAEIFNSGYWAGQQKFADATLEANDGTNFRVHRIVLTQRSGYFRALFDFSLNQETEIIPNIDRQILESILVYIYTGTIELDETNVCDMMIASDYLLLDDLLKICGSFAILTITSPNCLSILTTVSLINRLAIFEDCFRYALVHFTDILETSNGGLEILPFEILIKLLESKSLNVTSERSVWEVIISWTEANSSVRLPHVPALLACLRLQEETDEDLIAEILSHTIVSNNPHIFSQHTCLKSLYQNLPYSYDPRMPNRLHLIARNTHRGSELYLTYDNKFDFWRQIGKAQFIIHTMVQIGQHILVFSKQENANGIFDIVEEAWLEEEFPPMSRYSGWTINLGEKLYQIKWLHHTDRRRYYRIKISSYEFERNRWKSITREHGMIAKGCSVK
ncbi:Kelch-like protein 17 [Araneus ventricosus]|uniref:Kelch-like protein 17 n=1 Tax=Araneus ventricosus TaxID=182803 RepID=A0A4Y2AYH7_ARAVE|nr:Kelch-like protein 17 [Araneus ventricosus]